MKNIFYGGVSLDPELIKMLRLQANRWDVKKKDMNVYNKGVEAGKAALAAQILNENGLTWST